ncbi:MAG: ribonuclease R [Candidatus Firestonebacteria bacterium]
MTKFFHKASKDVQSPDNMQNIIKEFNLPLGFSEKVKVEINKIPDYIDISERKNRVELTNIIAVTIDGEDAKDFDDAVSIEQLQNGNFKLGVHIADVSYYVLPGTEVNNEAYRRATSVYLVDRVIPMLPEKLSNDLCSLIAGKDKLTITVFMEIDKKGEVLNYEILESVICSKKRLTYTIVAEIIEKENPEAINENHSLVPSLRLMNNLAKILYKKRIEDGSLDFDFPESKVVLDENNKPIKIIKTSRNQAYRMIEEFMLLANEIIAKHLTKFNVPSLYRVHPAPDIKDLQDFFTAIKPYGYKLKIGKEIHPKDLQYILKLAKGKPEEALINTFMLRALKLAVYSPVNVGHFGLSKKFYTHFTSPIRRYPDLLVHRVLRYLIKGELDDTKIYKLRKFLKPAGKDCSEKERIAEDAEDKSVKSKKIEFMADKIEKIYPGVITGVQAYGLFVEIEEFNVEGLIHVKNIKDDYYYFDQSKNILVGRRYKITYAMGDKIQIKVIKVDINKGYLDFVIVKI